MRAPRRLAGRLRAPRIGVWPEQARQDLRYGFRIFARRPGFTVAATLTLALGIGATATVYSLLDAALLRPLPVRQPDQLAHVYTSCRGGDVYCSSSYPEYLDYRSQNRTFADLAAFAPTGASVASDAGSWVARVLLVSTNYFTLLGVDPYRGRLISPADDAAADPVAILSHAAWVARFGADPDVIGRTVRVSGSPFRVAGVANPAFRGTRVDVQADLWVAIDNLSRLPGGGGGNRLKDRDTRWIGGTIGRLRPGVTLAQAQADMRLISDGLEASDPTRDRRFVTVEAANTAALPPAAARDIARFLLLLMGGVSATLLIACANIAGLLLARGAARRRELETRLALGAGRGRLIRQLLAEFILLAAAGTAGGIAIAAWAMGVLSSYNLPGALPIESLDVDLGPRVAGFAAVLLAATAVFGLIPALGTTRRLAATADSRTTGERAANLRAQRVLLGSQVAVTIVLLFGAGLFVRSLQHGLSLDLGLVSRSVVMAQIAPALEGYPPERTRALLETAVARLSSLPGVVVASAAKRPPLTQGDGFQAQEIEGNPLSSGESVRFESNFVMPGYFGALGIQLRSGREFASTDREGAPLVAVISETMARRYWTGRDPIGARIVSRSFPAPIEIVGVARDVTVGLAGSAEPFVYLPLSQHPRFLRAPVPMALFARTDADARTVAASLRGVLRAVDPSLPVVEVTTLDERIADLLMPQRLGSALLSALASLTTVLVAIGVTGMVGYAASRRRREIGVRLALGAQRGQVTGAVVRGALVPALAGMLVGLGVALLLGRLVSGFLYGIQPTDPATLVMAVLALTAVVTVAAFVPAWRAASGSATAMLTGE